MTGSISTYSKRITPYLDKQHVQCPVCDLGAHINYNERKVIHADP